MTPLLRRSGVGLPVCSATHRACGSCTTQERNGLKALIIIEAMIFTVFSKAGSEAGFWWSADPCQAKVLDVNSPLSLPLA